MASYVPQQVLCSEFFRRYDEFTRAASFKASSESAWKEVKAKHDKILNESITLENELKSNEKFSTEQVNRIQLVSTHWFYGTTALQPQLWLRRGCEGKIDRARKKLTKSRAEHNQILAAIENIDKNVLPPLRVQLEAQREKLNTAVEAETQCNTMKEAAIVQYPSARLLSLRDQGEAIRERLIRSESDNEGMRTALRYLSDSYTKYQGTLRSLYMAERHQEEYLKLREQCPHRDASEANWHQRKLDREVEWIDQAIEDASTLLLRADTTFRKAIATIPKPFRERYMNICLSFEVPRQIDLEVLRSGSRSTRRLECISRQTDRAKLSKLMVSEELVAAKELADKLGKEVASRREDSRTNTVAIEKEKDAILDGLRSHVSGTVDSSAPSEKFDFDRRDESASASSPSQPPTAVAVPILDGQGSAGPQTSFSEPFFRHVLT